MTITLVFLLIFVSVFGVVWGVSYAVTHNPKLEERLDRLYTAKPLTPTEEEVKNTDWQQKVLKLVGPIARLSAPPEGGETTYLKLRLMNAGLRQSHWPMVLFTAKTVMAFCLPTLALVYGGFSEEGIQSKQTLMLLLVLAALGYYLPNALLSFLIRSRQREIDEALPDAIDLVMVCVEAGLAIDAAIKRTCEELDLRSPALAEELGLVSLELQVGASRESAMQNLARRTGVEDVATFVTILIQSEQFGTNVAQSLRGLSEAMREKRRLRAEEQAAKIPLKMMFPTIFFIFPALFVVLLGPAVLSILRTLLPEMAGV